MAKWLQWYPWRKGSLVPIRRNISRKETKAQRVFPAGKRLFIAIKMLNNTGTRETSTSCVFRFYFFTGYFIFQEIKQLVKRFFIFLI